jgi:dTDP-4-dehydrorhamnose 3,5-epimerase
MPVSKFKFSETPLKGLVLIESQAFFDHRGSFSETYSDQEFQAAGLDARFVQDNQSTTIQGGLRGLHFQRGQGKLVRVAHGEIFDVAVDIRKDSPTFKKWYGAVLSSENRRQFYIPDGMAHGFLVLSKQADVVYKCTDFYNPAKEGGIIWNDPEIQIHWPWESMADPILSEKDRALKPLAETLI